MSDLIERLRHGGPFEALQVMEEAADALEAQAKRIAELEAECERRFQAGHAAGLEAAWIPMTNEDRPNENENVWITGIAYKKRFYAEAKWRKGEWLMFDQVADEHCMPCEFPDHWQRIVPPLSEQ